MTRLPRLLILASALLVSTAGAQVAEKGKEDSESRRWLGLALRWEGLGRLDPEERESEIRGERWDDRGDNGEGEPEFIPFVRRRAMGISSWNSW